jgi:NADPH:quinone reductase-like Zn-dependent oxidoreductase
MIGSAIRGGYAEYVVVPATNAFPIPDALTHVQAASLPTVFMPSWNILIRRSQLKPWETALVPSASSGVGTAAIQVAKNIAKSTVIATTSTAGKAEKAAALGSDHVINYKLEDVSERLKEITQGRGVDVVIDHVGTDIWNAANRRLATGARYGICGVTSGYKAELQMGAMFTRHLTMFGVFMGRSEDLEQIIYHAGQGTIKGVVDSEYPLQDVRKAHEDMEGLDFFGKLVITVD